MVIQAWQRVGTLATLPCVPREIDLPGTDCSLGDLEASIRWFDGDRVVVVRATDGDPLDQEDDHGPGSRVIDVIIDAADFIAFAAGVQYLIDEHVRREPRE